MPILMMLILGQIEMMRLGMVTQLLATAAREGARVAVLDGSTQTSVQNRIDAVLDGSKISVGTVVPTTTVGTNWTTAPGGTPITITLSVPYEEVSWLPVPRFLKNATVTASATLSSERK